MNTVVPALRIHDYETAKKFYVDGLGFHIDFEWRHEPGFPVFMQISRGGMRLYLTEHEGDCSGSGLVYLYVQDVDAWQADFLTRGVVAEGPPQNQPWGNRELPLRDPDGNRLRICSVIAE